MSDVDSFDHLKIPLLLFFLLDSNLVILCLENILASSDRSEPALFGRLELNLLRDQVLLAQSDLLSLDLIQLGRSSPLVETRPIFVG